MKAAEKQWKFEKSKDAIGSLHTEKIDRFKTDQPDETGRED